MKHLPCHRECRAVGQLWVGQMDPQSSNIPFQKVIFLLGFFPREWQTPSRCRKSSACLIMSTACIRLLPLVCFPPPSQQPSASPFPCPCFCFLIKCTKVNGIQTHSTQQRQGFLPLRYLGKGHQRRTRCKKTKKKRLRYFGKINQVSFEGERHLRYVTF